MNGKSHNSGSDAKDREGRGRGRGREDGEELWARDSSKMNKARQTV